MSIAATAIGELAIAAGSVAPTSTSTRKTPRKRTVTAKADLIQQPEAR